MLPDRVSNPGPLTYESGALPIALRGPAIVKLTSIAKISQKACKYIHQADLHVQDSFLLSISLLNSADASKLENAAENCSLSFWSQHATVKN